MAPGVESVSAANRCLNRPTTGGQLFKRAPSAAALVWRRSTLAPGEGTRIKREGEKEGKRERRESGAVNCRLSRARSDRDHRRSRRGIASSKLVRKRR